MIMIRCALTCLNSRVACTHTTQPALLQLIPSLPLQLVMPYRLWLGSQDCLKRLSQAEANSNCAVFEFENRATCRSEQGN